MDTLATWDAVQRHIGGVSRGAGTFTTNLFLTADQVEHWSATAPLRGLSVDGAALVLRADDGFQRVYHAAESPIALTAALSELSSGVYVSDLIGQDTALEAAGDAYRAAGFSDHAFLQRMARMQPSDVHPAPAGGVAEVAMPADAPAIAALLRRLLDPFTEQLPTESDLAAAAAEGRLLVDRHGDDPGGMLMFGLKGQVAHLQFWHVDHAARGSGVGRTLMTGFLERCARARRIVLWVIGDNARSIAIYRHYGFYQDGLIDRIMLLHKD